MTKVWMEALQMTIMSRICLTVKKIYLNGPKHKLYPFSSKVIGFLQKYIIICLYHVFKSTHHYMVEKELPWMADLLIDNHIKEIIYKVPWNTKMHINNVFLKQKGKIIQQVFQPTDPMTKNVLVTKMSVPEGYLYPSPNKRVSMETAF